MGIYRSFAQFLYNQPLHMVIIDGFLLGAAAEVALHAHWNTLKSNEHRSTSIRREIELDMLCNSAARACAEPTAR